MEIQGNYHFHFVAVAIDETYQGYNWQIFSWWNQA